MPNIKFALIMAAVMIFATAGAKTIRVNNVVAASADYTNPSDALSEASDGDVIIIEPSPTSYGSFDVSKQVTIKGGGYFHEINDPTETGNANSKVEDIKIYVPNVTITGLETGNITVYASKTVITRCNILNIDLGATYSDSGEISDCIIHQNFISGGLNGSQYGTLPTDLQVTNNIFTKNSQAPIYNLTNSVIKYNTLTYNSAGIYDCGMNVKNCVIEYNLGGTLKNADNSNSTANNSSIDEENPYGFAMYKLTDKDVKDVDTAFTSEYGAFAGATPYILSGTPSGPVVLDLELPTTVGKGEDLNVTVTIGLQK